MSEPPVPEDPAGGSPPSAADSDAHPTLTATGRVILGMIGLGKVTGYDIKQLVDKSTRHFWAASYGQIYPELRRLESQGLVRGRSQPSGGRPRTVYELTEAGRTALENWLCRDQGLVWELRDEGLLKLFFSDLLGAEGQRAVLAQMRSELERKYEQLATLHPAGPSGPRLTLDYGLGMTRWMLDWCKEAERRLAQQAVA